MLRARKTTILALVLALVVASQAAGCVFVEDDGDSTLRVDNESDYTLTEVRLAAVGQRDWGPNLLPDVLYPGEELLVVDIRCGEYSVLVVDENGLPCVLGNLEMCFDDEEWVIDNRTLDICAFNP